MYSALCLSFLFLTSSTFWQTAFSQTPVRVIAAAGAVATLTQIVKKLYPAVAGKYAMGINLLFSIASILSATNPENFWASETWSQIVAVFAAAAGAHSTYRALRPATAADPAQAPAKSFLRSAESMNQFGNSMGAQEGKAEQASAQWPIPERRKSLMVDTNQATTAFPEYAADTAAERAAQKTALSTGSPQGTAGFIGSASGVIPEASTAAPVSSAAETKAIPQAPASAILGAALLFCIIGGLTGCTDFERTSFNTLSASQAVINQAQVDYEAKTIPQSACAYAVVNDAKAAQTAAVDAMLIYEQQKAAGTNLTAQTATVAADLLELPVLVADIKNLYVNPAGCTAPAAAAAPAATSSGL